MIAALRRAYARMKILALEIQLHDLTAAMRDENSQESLFALSLARQQTRRALAKARGDYNSALPPGERRTWSAA